MEAILKIYATRRAIYRQKKMKNILNDKKVIKKAAIGAIKEQREFAGLK